MRYVFTDRLGAQSIWSLIDQIAVRLVARGDEVLYYRIDDRRQGAGAAIPHGVEGIDVRVPAKTRIWHLLPQQKQIAEQFARWLKSIRPDVVHTHFCVPGVVARIVARRAGVRTIISTQHETRHSMYPHYRWAVQWTEKYADAIVYVSQTVAVSFGRRAVRWPTQRDEPAPRHLIVPNGIDLAMADRIRESAAGREAGKLVCAGRLVAGKGHEQLLHVLPRVRALFPGVHLILIGTGPREDRLRELAADLGIAPAVTFAGSIPHEQVLGEMATAEAVVVPSTGPEGFGLVVAEAMAVGTPVVATRIPAFQEVFGEENLSLCSPEPYCLARALREVLSAPELRQRRAEKARDWVHHNCSADRMARDYLQLYDALTEKQETVRGRPALRV